MVQETLAEKVTSALIDPLWLSIAGGPGAWQFLMRFSKGASCVVRKAQSPRVRAAARQRGDRTGRRAAVSRVSRGDVPRRSALTGDVRTASMRAVDEVWVLMFNAAGSEQFVTANPALGMRMIKSLAERLSRESKR